MSDTTTVAPEAPSVPINAESLANIGTAIGEFDTKIASASGNDTVARKAFIEQITGEHAEDVNSIVTSIIEQLKAKDAPVLVGLVNRLTESMKTDLEPVVNTWVDAEFPKTKVDSTVDVAALKEQRKTQLSLFKALREVLNTFKIPNDHIPDPKRSGGGRPAGSGSGGTGTKSGMNKEKYRYTMNGKKRPKSQNGFSSLAFYATDGVPKALAPEDPSPRKRWSTDEFRTFIKEAGVNYGVDDTWEVELPNGTKVGAARFTPEDYAEFGIDPDAPETTDTPDAPAVTETATVEGVAGDLPVPADSAKKGAKGK